MYLPELLSVNLVVRVSSARKLAQRVLTGHLQNSITDLGYVSQMFHRYSYQLPPGNQNHTCGGAAKWVDVVSSREVFCTGGSYCPSTIQKIPCISGHFCRQGSTTEEDCFRMATCKLHSENQNITAYGIMIFVSGLTHSFKIKMANVSLWNDLFMEYLHS